MANMITRTFTGWNVKFMTISDEGSVRMVSKFYMTSDKEKAIKKATAEMAGIGIFKGAEMVEELRGMSVDDFYAMSVPVTRPASQQKGYVSPKKKEVMDDESDGD